MTLLIVDGYNIIHSWQDFSDLRAENMGIARVKLVEMLDEFVPLLWQKIIIVFDAYRVKGKTTSVETVNGVEVVYTAEGKTADVFIERLVVNLIEIGEEVEVASSDNLEQHIVLWKGACRVSARELKERLQECHAAMKKGYLRSPPLNVLDERISDKVKTVLEKWRRL